MIPGHFTSDLPFLTIEPNDPQDLIFSLFYVIGDFRGEIVTRGKHIICYTIRFRVWTRTCLSIDLFFNRSLVLSKILNQPLLPHELFFPRDHLHFVSLSKIFREERLGSGLDTIHCFNE